MKENWTYKKLGEVVEINYGTRVVQKKDGGSIYPVYGGGGATFKMDTYNREDCLVVARFAMSKQCTRRVAGKFFLNDSGLTLSAKKELTQPYLDWHIIALNDAIYNTAKGAAQKNLDVSAFKNLRISFPNEKSTQHSIVQELDTINEVLSKKREQLKELDRLAQSIFYDMFGDPVTNEKGWEVKKLGEVADFYNGKAHEQDIDESGAYILVNSKFIASDSTIYKRTNKQILPLYINDIVMVMSDVPNGRALAKCFLVDKDKTYSLNQRICAFRHYRQNPIYMYYALNRNAYFLEFDDGDSQTNLRKDDVLGCSIPLPPLPLQQAFAEKIEKIEQMKQNLKASIHETEMLLESRMSYWFE